MNRHLKFAERNGNVDPPWEEGFELSRDEWEQLELVDSAGRRVRNVRVVPLFPITDPDHWVSICDAAGRELVCVTDPTTLDAKTRAVLQEELLLREFLPVIQRIVSVSGNSEPCEWQVETDRGPTRFVLESDDHLRRLGANRVTVIDANGIRYLIDDVQKLDRKSRRIVEWYV
jgi:Domain of unknown function (DUF1854)